LRYGVEVHPGVKIFFASVQVATLAVIALTTRVDGVAWFAWALLLVAVAYISFTIYGLRRDGS
jgi:hypothetical protein